MSTQDFPLAMSIINKQRDEIEDDMPLFYKSLKEWSEELLKKPLANRK